jgi:hypothetical protein
VENKISENVCRNCQLSILTFRQNLPSSHSLSDIFSIATPHLFFCSHCIIYHVTHFIFLYFLFTAIFRFIVYTVIICDFRRFLYFLYFYEEFLLLLLSVN